MSQLSAVILQKLNEQYVHEHRNQLIYEECASVADFFGLIGTSSFFTKQAQGEAEHAKAVYDFINTRNEHAEIKNLLVPTVPQDFFEMFKFTMQVELETTDRLKSIASQALIESDFQTFYWISDLIKEQTEEENITRTIIDRFSLCGNDPEMIHHYDIFIGQM